MFHMCFSVLRSICRISVSEFLSLKASAALQFVRIDHYNLSQGSTKDFCHQMLPHALQVKEMKRRDMYERHMLLQKIQQETIKAHSLLEQRTALQEARKMANMDASFQRQKLLVAVEKLTTTKNWTSFVGNDGGINVEAMMH